MSLQSLPYDFLCGADKVRDRGAFFFGVDGRMSLIKTLSSGGRARLRQLQAKSKSLILVWLACSAIGIFLTESNLGRLLEYQNARRLEFVVRNLLGQVATPDPRIRIFAFDDNAIAAVNAPELLLSDWTAMLRSLRERAPRTILIDKMFGYISSKENDDLAAFIDEASQHKSLAIGSFVSSTPIPLRASVDLVREEFKIQDDVSRSPELDAWLPEHNMQVYGPLKEIAKRVHIGQIMNSGFGSVFPMIRVKPDRAIPHLGFFAAENFRVAPQGPEVDGKLLPLDRYGLLNINFLSPAQYYRSANSMRSLLERSRHNKPITDVKEGDIVILLPLMFTGNTDLIETPLGKIPAGFIHATIATSILQGSWLRPIGSPWFIVLMLSALGAFLGTMAEPKWFWGVLLAALITFIGGALLAFSFAGIVLPWLYAVVAFGCAALCMQAIKTLELREHSLRLNAALSGLMPKEKLKDMLNGNNVIVREPTEAVVSVMFLDISNFSHTALQMQAKEVFFNLKAIMDRIASSVHRHGGTIDRTMGDGLLCFFGYSYDERSHANHAQAALACAREIQRENVRECAAGNGKSAPIWPFRIGINTTSAFIGDLGNKDRIDFTLIGNGVNLAQRFEAACAHHSIMMSPTTFELTGIPQEKMQGVHRCKIKIKNQRELADCVEVDPLTDMQAEKMAAMSSLRAYLALERGEERWPVVSNSGLKFVSSYGEGTLVDFSKSGVCLLLPVYLAKGAAVTFEVTSSNAPLDERMRLERLAKFRVEVRWSRPKDQQYLHGFLFADMNEAQLDLFFSLLRAACAPP
jgi:class 3 adenylate cyclase/CHASE2 domain-containing sensor protein